MDKRRAIPFERLPGSYSTIYLLSTLDPASLKAAEADGLVRPELRRAELIAWKRGRDTFSIENRASLEAKREKLRRERERLDEELRRIDAALAGVLDD